MVKEGRGGKGGGGGSVELILRAATMYIQAKAFQQSINNSAHQARLPNKTPVHEVENPQNHGLFDQKLDFLPNILAEISASNQPTNREKYLMGNGKCDGQGIEYCCVIAQLPAAKEVVSIYSRDKRKTSSRQQAGHARTRKCRPSIRAM